MSTEEKLLKVIALHLEDISKSLKIISGRIEPDKKEQENKTYASKYFERSEQ